MPKRSRKLQGLSFAALLYTTSAFAPNSFGQCSPARAPSRRNCPSPVATAKSDGAFGNVKTEDNDGKTGRTNTKPRKVLNRINGDRKGGSSASQQLKNSRRSNGDEGDEDSQRPRLQEAWRLKPMRHVLKRALDSRREALKSEVAQRSNAAALPNAGSSDETASALNSLSNNEESQEEDSSNSDDDSVTLLRRRGGRAKEKGRGSKAPEVPPSWVSEEKALALGRARLKRSAGQQARADHKLAAAVAADMRGDLATSEQLLEECAKLAPHDGRVWRRWSRMARMRGDWVLAEKRLRTGLKHLPESPHLLHGLAELFKGRGDLARARVYYRRALAVDSSFVPSLHAWGRLEAKLGEVRLAQQLLSKGLAVEPLNTRLLFASAVLFSSLGRHGDALELLDRGLQNPTGSGNYRARTGPPSADGSSQWQATAKPGTHPDLVLAKAVIEFQMGNVPEARRKLRFLTQRTQRGVYLPKAWLALGRLEEASGNVEWARSVYQQACAFGSNGYARPPSASSSATSPFSSSSSSSSDGSSSSSSSSRTRGKKTSCKPGQEAGVALWQSWARFEELQGDAAARRLKHASSSSSQVDAYTGAYGGSGYWSHEPRTLASVEAKRGHMSGNGYGEDFYGSGYGNSQPPPGQADVYQACCDVYAEATTRFEDDAQLWWGWAAVEAKRGRHRESAELFERAIQAAPHDLRPYHAVAKAAAASGQWHKARAMYFRGLAQYDGARGARARYDAGAAAAALAIGREAGSDDVAVTAAEGQAEADDAKMELSSSAAAVAGGAGAAGEGSATSATEKEEEVWEPAWEQQLGFGDGPSSFRGTTSSRASRSWSESANNWGNGNDDDDDTWAVQYNYRLGTGILDGRSADAPVSTTGGVAGAAINSAYGTSHRFRGASTSSTSSRSSSDSSYDVSNDHAAAQNLAPLLLSWALCEEKLGDTHRAAALLDWAVRSCGSSATGGGGTAGIGKSSSSGSGFGGSSAMLAECWTARGALELRIGMAQGLGVRDPLDAQALEDGLGHRWGDNVHQGSTSSASPFATPSSQSKVSNTLSNGASKGGYSYHSSNNDNGDGEVDTEARASSAHGNQHQHQQEVHSRGSDPWEVGLRRCQHFVARALQAHPSHGAAWALWATAAAALAERQQLVDLLHAGLSDPVRASAAAAAEPTLRVGKRIEDKGGGDRRASVEHSRARDVALAAVLALERAYAESHSGNSAPLTVAAFLRLSPGFVGSCLRPVLVRQGLPPTCRSGYSGGASSSQHHDDPSPLAPGMSTSTSTSVDAALMRLETARRLWRAEGTHASLAGVAQLPPVARQEAKSRDDFYRGLARECFVRAMLLDQDQAVHGSSGFGGSGSGSGSGGSSSSGGVGSSGVANPALSGRDFTASPLQRTFPGSAPAPAYLEGIGTVLTAPPAPPSSSSSADGSWEADPEDE